MKRILVPLDLKTEPETVVQVVADAARGAGATVRLLHVAPPPESVVDVDGRVICYADQEAARLEAEALDYLSTVEIGLDGIPVEPVVRFGDPAEEILLEADAFGADLIALTTERTGLRRLVLGGTVGRVCRRAETAVMLVQPPALIAA